MKKTLLFLLLIATATGFSQTETEIKVNTLISGTLFSPAKTDKSTKLVILIAGSGPTDRNGNQSGLENNSLKFLAQEIVKSGTAVFSYDKRLFAMAASGNTEEGKLSFGDFITDAKDVITYFKNQKKYSKIIVAGHSEGSLIGMVASEGIADGFISIAGPGQNIGDTLIEQIGTQMPGLKSETEKYVALLKKGQTFTLENQMLASIFRENLQPFMISWMKYEPTISIQKLKIPVLIINGTKDLQVKVADAELLKKAKPDATLTIIPDMNHVFKEIKGDQAENAAAYSNPNLPVMKALADAVNQFTKTI